MSKRRVLEHVLLKYFSDTEDVTLESADELALMQATVLVENFVHEIAQNIRAKTAETYPRVLMERGADYAAGWSFARMRIADELEGFEG